MLDQLKKLIYRSRANNPESEPYNHLQQPVIEWQPLDVSRLNLTSRRLREIEASLAEKTRAEFAAVTKELTKTQLDPGQRDEN
jgi:hypothetical protein